MGTKIWNYQSKQVRDKQRKKTDWIHPYHKTRAKNLYNKIREPSSLGTSLTVDSLWPSVSVTKLFIDRLTP